MIPIILLMSAALPSLADLTPDEIAYLYASGDTDLQEAVYNATQCQYYTFQPRPDSPDDYEEQTAFVNDKTSSLAICLGGNGSGKTLAAAYKTAKYVLETPPPRVRCPFWIVGEKLDQCAAVCWGEKLSHIIPLSSIAAVRYADTKMMQPKAVLLKHPTIPNEVGWVLEFRSYDQGVSAFKSESIGGYWCNEEVPYKILWEIYRGCRDYNSPGWADFTPVECKDPEWPEAYERCQGGNGPEGWKFYHLNTLKNPFISEKWKQEFLANLPEEDIEMRTLGKFSALRGQVFKEFRKHIHTIAWERDPRHPDRQTFEEVTGYRRIPSDWMKYRGLDFGYNDPFVCLWCAKDRDGRYYFYDEHYRNQGFFEEHAEAIHKREWDESQPWYGRTYSDHDPQVRAELTKFRINCTPADKRPDSVKYGINMLRSLMKVKGDGRPQFYVFADKCPNLVREIIGLKWAEGTTGRNSTDMPLDKDNHTIDASRYIIFSERVGGRDMKATGWKNDIDGKRHGVLADFGGGRRMGRRRG